MEYDVNAGAEEFDRDGFLLVESVLTGAECRELVREIEDARADLPMPGSDRWFSSQLHLRSPAFAGLLDRSPAVDLAERLLRFEHGDPRGDETVGEQHHCHVINMTAIVARPGDPHQTVHVDDYIVLPRPVDVPWDERIRFPTFLVTAMYYLVDVGRDMGATLVVPGSHRSGRKPPAENPSYEGNEQRPVEVKAGDCLLFHHLLWHGALAHRGRTPRYLLQVHYAARFIAPRMAPFPNHHTPPAFFERLTARQQRLAGAHRCFAPYC